MSDRHQAQAYPLRLPDDLKAKVAGAAKDAGRSLNAEIIARLQASFLANQALPGSSAPSPIDPEEVREVTEALQDLDAALSLIKKQVSGALASPEESRAALLNPLLEMAEGGWKKLTPKKQHAAALPPPMKTRRIRVRRP